MHTTIHNLYSYDHIHQLLFVDDGQICFMKDNAPMVNNDITIHKGVDNRVVFRVLGPDRSPVNMCQYQLMARVNDTSNGTIVLEKPVSQGSVKGTLFLELDSGDITDIHAGTYGLVIIATQPFVTGQHELGATIERPLFIDQYSNVSMILNITDQALHDPVPSVVLCESDWTGDSFFPVYGPPSFGFYSKAIAGGRVLNHRSSIHTFSTYTENFTGVLELYGTLDETPTAYLDSTRWFKIYPSTMSQDIIFTEYTGTQAWAFQCNAMWLKFRYFPSTQVPDPGKMKKIIFRA